MENQEKNQNSSERVFYDTYEWIYVVKHPTTEEETEICIYADNYDESLTKLKLLKLPYKTKDYHLAEVVNFEPNVITNISVDPEKPVS